jgi:hypothetical protein
MDSPIVRSSESEGPASPPSPVWDRATPVICQCPITSEPINVKVIHQPSWSKSEGHPVHT